LTELEPSASGFTTSKYQVRDPLDNIEINHDKMEENDTRNTAHEEASEQDNASPNERQKKRRKSTVTGRFICGSVSWQTKRRRSK